MNKEKKLMLTLTLCVSILICLILLKLTNISSEIKEINAKTAETETHYTYVICDVADYYGDCPEDIYATNLVCEMPDGTLHTYTIEDAPEEAELVCFRTDNQDDYAAYEVVAVR